MHDYLLHRYSSEFFPSSFLIPEVFHHLEKIHLPFLLYGPVLRVRWLIACLIGSGYVKEMLSF